MQQETTVLVYRTMIPTSPPPPGYSAGFHSLVPVSSHPLTGFDLQKSIIDQPTVLSARHWPS